MKNYVIGLIFLGLTTQMYSQVEIAETTDNTDVVVSKSMVIKNPGYLTAFKKEEMPERVRKLQKIVADYDIKSLSIYTSKERSIYSVVFTEGNNEIRAVYNQEGTIINCNEAYEAIRLPFALSSKIIKDNPGWAINNVKCTITYSKYSNVKILYKVKLKKDNKRKTVKINA